MLVSKYLKATEISPRDPEKEISEECDQLIQSPKIDDSTLTREEMVCLYWDSGNSQKDAENMADKTLLENDTNKNGAIDGDDYYLQQLGRSRNSGISEPFRLGEQMISLTKQARSDEEWTNDCRDVLLSDESGNGQVTLRYLKCMYWAYGFTKQEAETFAKMGTMQFLFLICYMLFWSNILQAHNEQDVTDLEECRNLLLSPEFDDDIETMKESMCMYWAYGYSKDEAESLANQSFQGKYNQSLSNDKNG
ncbi:Hypothetical predicted protein [Mytilus galloprovincialis]|uniref:EF-hand domain-containing protein n=1 Tax=Mytilus galloprovincialis TaxID=29158 RepID=A0A8B6CHE5_MYTGA|nr:Hypothetical predicted protein [Mytilus galloprovincialis]